MAGGMKKMIINTQERAVSTDINRLQAFAGAGLAESLRYMLDVTGNDDLDAGGLIVEPNTLETPLRAEIINGLLVRPQIGSFNLRVDPGVMLALAPDAAADDSKYKYVADPGVLANGLLVMATNGGGSIRIDIIECQVSEVITETSNRDIFDPTNGTFAATSVTKARANTCTFVGGATNVRVRQGTAGSGIPARAAGWLPLCIAAVPPGAASNDDITFWDVRPLLSDREFTPFAIKSGRPTQHKLALNASTPSAASAWMSAVVNGRRVGGRLRRGTPGTDSDTVIDLTSTANADTGAAMPTNAPWYLFLVTPFGLPRWARYTDFGSGNRVPRSPRGIPVVTQYTPDADGNPLVAIALPPSTGLGGTTSTGVCVFAGYTNGASMGGVYGDDQGQMLVDGGAITHNPTVATATGAAGVITLSFAVGGTPGAGFGQFPMNAKALLLEFRLTHFLQGPIDGGTISTDLEVWSPNGAASKLSTHRVFTAWDTITANTTMAVAFRAWVELPSVYPGVSYITQVLKLVNLYGGATTTAQPTCDTRIVGWRF